MALENLSTKLKDSLSKIAKSMFVDDRLIDELIKDLQRALLQADVNVQLVFDLSKNIKARIKEEKTPTTLTQKEHLINIVYEELTKFLGGEKNEIKIDKKPFKILLVGLYGSGKTTSAAKIAKFYQKRGYKIALVQTDTWRPAAYKQLQTLGEQIKAPVYGSATEKDPLQILKEAEKHFKEYDIVIIDSAGRDALSEELITEIETLNKELKPNEVLLVISADIGQAAQKQAEQFHKSCNVTGVVATKMDGTAKAGGALSACSVTGAPVKFIGVGEKIDDLEQFNPKGFVGRMLGMGDLEALLEKAKEAMTEEDAEALGKKFLKGDFNFLDLYEQLQAMGKMGSMTKIMEMIPGLGGIKIPKEMIQGQENKLKIWKHIMQSMTKEELEDPEILTSGRIDRIAAGSGHPASEVRQLLKQYRQTKKLMKMAKGANDPNKLLKKFKGKIPGL
ncbi:MAG: signal recognition particle protein Srp54 [archaeon]